MVFSPNRDAVVTRWWHVRHAPVPNPRGHIYGQEDADCDTSDTAAFDALARALPAEPAWVVSTLRRTRQTADAIQMARGTSVEASEEADLVEQSFGDWQGRSPSDAYAEQGVRHPFWLSQRYAGRDIVAVTHGGTIRAAIALALDLSAETALRFSIDNLSITRIDHIDIGTNLPLWRLVALNRTVTP